MCTGILLVCWVLMALLPVHAQLLKGSQPVLVIPRVEKPPRLEDFLEMKPSPEWEGKLLKVEDFIQRSPSDGAPASQPTVAYLGYDDKNLYTIWVAFDSEPDKIRARMGRRDTQRGDDIVHILLDTQNDQRRAYSISTNAFGLQWDSMWTEGERFDDSYDTVWHSDGRVTGQGYVVWMAIPFKSLRFPATKKQVWGVLLERDIPRANEAHYWPHYSSRIEGRLNQAAILEGLEDISPGRNIQLIPYGSFRSFRALDERDPARPRFVEDDAEFDAGLDAKFVFKDTLVLDATFNPDFSQVESDEPQVTANQRFEVFFPEKRPFFLENANFFRTPINLVFTRRIADPQFGARLSGKAGPYTIGALLMDDQAPGRVVLPADPQAGKRATVGIVRLSRDILNQSSVGMIYTVREFEQSYSRVGGIDARIKWNRNWVSNFQAVTSATRDLDGVRSAGPAYNADVRRSGRQFTYAAHYEDRSSGFATQLGFVPRVDIRRVSQLVRYRFRPEGKRLISWGPAFELNRLWDHSGTRLDWIQNPSVGFELIGQTRLSLFYVAARERLRPVDFAVLPQARDFKSSGRGFSFSSNYIPELSVSTTFFWEQAINFVPPGGQEPVLANRVSGSFRATLRPLTPLRIDNSYLLTRMRDRPSGASVFNNHIFRSKWNWQFSRRLSLRFIAQYNALLSNPELTSLSTRKNVNADLLLTYRVNPWTALFVGYNSNAQNLLLCEGQGIVGTGCPDLPAGTGELIRTRNRFVNDSRQVFVKFSYLVRF